MSWQQAYRGYLFDLDGTLIDTAPDINAAQNATLIAHGYRATEEDQTRHWVGHGARALLQQAIAEQASAPVEPAQLDVMHREFLAHYSENIANASAPYRDVVPTLAALRERGAKLAVVTNKVESLSRILLDALALRDCFDALVGGDTAKTPKPSADPALLACQQLQLEAADVLFVGDSETDVGCARAFGCAVVCVSYGYNHGKDPASLGADGVIDSFAALL